MKLNISKISEEIKGWYNQDDFPVVLLESNDNSSKPRFTNSRSDMMLRLAYKDGDKLVSISNCYIFDSNGKITIAWERNFDVILASIDTARIQEELIRHAVDIQLQLTSLEVLVSSKAGMKEVSVHIVTKDGAKIEKYWNDLLDKDRLHTIDNRFVDKIKVRMARHMLKTLDLPKQKLTHNIVPISWDVENSDDWRNL